MITTNFKNDIISDQTKTTNLSSDRTPILQSLRQYLSQRDPQCVSHTVMRIEEFLGVNMSKRCKRLNRLEGNLVKSRNVTKRYKTKLRDNCRNYCRELNSFDNDYVFQSDFTVNEEILLFLCSLQSSLRRGGIVMLVADHLESISLLVGGLKRCSEPAHYIEEAWKFIKAVTGIRHVSYYIFCYLLRILGMDVDAPVLPGQNAFRNTRGFNIHFQADDDSLFDSVNITNIRRKYKRVLAGLDKHEVIGKILNIVAFIFASKVIDVSKQGVYGKMMKSFIKSRPKEVNNFNFTFYLIDAILAACELFQKCLSQQSLKPLLGEETSYSKFTNEVEFLMLESLRQVDCHLAVLPSCEFMNRVSEASVLASELKPIIDEKGYAALYFMECYNKIKKLEVEVLASSLVQSDREVPFSILLFGGAGQGKTALMDLLFMQYAHTFGLPDDPKYRFMANPRDKFFSGYTSDKWSCWFDDLAYEHSNKVTEIPRSLDMIMRVVNNIPVTTEQAEVSKKGKIPFRSEQVIASTNVKRLDVTYYFNNQGAILRRLPLVVTVEAKEKYLNNGVLNGAMMPDCMLKGERPDYWKITVEKVVLQPIVNEKQQSCTYKKVLETESIHEFLAFYSREAIKHKQYQSQVTDIGRDLRKDFDFCKECFNSNKYCKCSVQEVESQADLGSEILSPLPYISWPRPSRDLWCVISTWFSNLMVILIMFQLFCLNKISVNVSRWYCLFMMWYAPSYGIRYGLRYGITKKLLASPASYLGVSKTKLEQAQKVLTLIIVACTTALIGKQLYNHYAPCKEDESCVEESEIKHDEGKCEDCLSEQGSLVSHEFRKPLPMANEIPRCPGFYYNNDLVLQPRLDISPATASSRLDIEVLRDKFYRNTLVSRCNNGMRDVHCNWLCLTGHLYVTNYHCVKEYPDKVEIALLQDNSSSGISCNVHRVTFNYDELIIDKDYDYCYYVFKVLPPKSNILKFFSLLPLKVPLRVEVLLNSKNIKNIVCVPRAILSSIPFPPHGKEDLPVYKGSTDGETIAGDCGAPYVALTPMGPVILGLHALRYKNDDVIACVCLTQKRILEFVGSLVNVEVEGGFPAMEDPIVPLVALHHKSEVRYIPQGHAGVYGTLSDHNRNKRKSKVVKSLLCEASVMMGYECVDAAPEMVSWEPWNLALEPMVNTETLCDSKILNACVQSYVNKIESGVNLNELFFTIHAYDLFVATNGCPGITYVDGIKRSSSCGYPWRKCKRFFLKDSISEEYPEGVEFEKEMVSRIEKIWECYARGQTWCPIFQGNLKDEVVSKEKSDAKKTRVFAGGPVDWIMVQRMLTMGHSRFIKNNKFLCETAIGINAMSVEWSELVAVLRDKSPQLDHVFAGDYSKFDKRMAASFILAAYQVLIELSYLAVWDEEEVQMLRCLANDTAFAWMNYNGTLIQFFGSNPSGHSLTTEINSIVNALYMRYAYYLLNPVKECESFASNVSLITYGDDNIVAVKSDIAMWFNHTAVSEALATIGVVYTMAEKEAESEEFTDFSKLTFLKRKFVFDESIGEYLCPLDPISLNRSLTMWIPSSVISKEEQAVSILSSVGREYFFYGQSIYENKCDVLHMIGKMSGLGNYMPIDFFPPYKDLVEEYVENGKRIRSVIRLGRPEFRLNTVH